MIDDRSIERFDPIRGVGKKPGNWRKIPGHVFHVAGAREDLLKRELASISIDGGRGEGRNKRGNYRNNEGRKNDKNEKRYLDREGGLGEKVGAVSARERSSSSTWSSTLVGS